MPHAGIKQQKNGDHGGKSVLQAKPHSGRRLGKSEAQALLCLHSAPTSTNRIVGSHPNLITIFVQQKMVITVGIEPTIARMKTWSPNH